MPTYQYACTEPDCGNRFELVQSFTDPSVTECPVCNGAVRKVYGSVGVVFKGSGFYRTDSRSSSETKDPAKKSESKSESTSNSKSAAKSDSSSSAKSDSSASSSSATSSSSASSSSGKAAASA
jgi:putative FmdB family regulatory protein